MVMATGNASEELSINTLRRQISQFARSNRQLAIQQVFNTFIPYLGLWTALIYLVKHQYSWAIILPLLILAALFLVRIFIILHDCAHNSFFTSRRANAILGYLAGFLTFTPFTYWQHNHLVHHGTYADLDHRGVGDIWTLTVAEYQASSPRTRLAYRLYRTPFVLLLIGPGYSFLITQRYLHQWEGKNERFSVGLTNLVILLVILAAALTIGLPIYLLIQVPIILLAGAFGVWLFYVQHQFEGVYWSRHKDWDPVKAAMQGSSYYKLPEILQWFTGHIGLHHLHHVLPRIPNYRLQECYNASPVMQTVKPIGLRRSLKSFSLNLWDENQQALVSFRSLTEARR